MIARALLLIAVFVGLIGGQIEARGTCGSAELCAGCCAPESDASCCRTNDTPAPPLNAPATNQAHDWKLIATSLVAKLPKRDAITLQQSHGFLHQTPRTTGLARIERTCARII